MTTPDDVDLSGYPNATTASVTADTFTTNSTELVDVPGAQLSFYAREGDTWIVLFSGRLGSATAREPSPNSVAYTVNGVERGIGTAQSGVAGSLGPWQHMDWLTGSNANVDVRLRLRTSNANDATLANASIVAFRVPAEASMASASADNAQLVTKDAFAPVTSLTFTPETDGDYLILGVLNGQETPGQSDIYVRWRTPGGALWNDGLQNPRGTQQSFFLARRITLEAREQTFVAEARGSTTGAGSTVQYARLVALRLDGFDGALSNQRDTVNVAPSRSGGIVSATSEQLDTPRPHIVIQTLYALYACGGPADAVLGPTFTIGGAITSAYAYSPGSCVYRATFGDVRLIDTADAFEVGSSFVTTNVTNIAHEASTHILRVRF